MHRGQLAAGAGALAVAITGAGIATAATSAAGVTTIKAVTGSGKVRINRYVQDTIRWDRDVYTVRSGGMIRIVNDAAQEGPHTFTVVAQRDLPRTFRQVTSIQNCKICIALAKAHGANPESNAPPKFQYLENGVGQHAPPKVDRPGDSGLTGQGRPGESITLRVTAKPGTVLNFMCLIHPWMQAKLRVVK